MKLIGSIISYGLAMISGALAFGSYEIILKNTLPNAAFWFALGLILTGLSLIMSVLVRQFIGDK